MIAPKSGNSQVASLMPNSTSSHSSLNLLLPSFVLLFRVLCEEVIIKTNMTIRLLSLLATLNKAVKAEPPVTLTLLATLKEVEEEIKQGLVALQLSLILHECSAVSTFSQQGWRRVLYQVTNVKVKYTQNGTVLIKLLFQDLIIS